jgi:hypothetical protein
MLGELERAVEAQKFEDDKRLRRDSHEFNLAAIRSDALVKRHQYSDPGAVDEAKLGQVYCEDTSGFIGECIHDGTQLGTRKSVELASDVERGPFGASDERVVHVDFAAKERV